MGAGVVETSIISRLPEASGGGLNLSFRLLYLVHPPVMSESSSFLLFPGKRMVQPQRGLIPSILPTHWDRATLLFPSYHLPPTILKTFP